MSPVIETRDLSKWFGEVVAVNNLTLALEPGVIGLLGPNGAGKSTLIRLALGLYRPSRGEIRVFGASPRNNLDVLCRVGYCPESDWFHEGMTGYEFVYWMNRYGGMVPAAARKAAEEACARVRMTDRMHDPIATYSKGMRQRIKIAQALAPDPELLFLDEPMAGLDPEGREEMFALIRRQGEAGRTVLISTHILYEVERVTTNLVLLHNGCLLAHGRIREIRDLLDEYPHTVTVTCRDPHRLSDRFIEDAATVGVELDGDAATIRTRDPNGFYQKLNDLILDDFVGVTAIRRPDENLQAVFDYLVK